MSVYKMFRDYKRSHAPRGHPFDRGVNYTLDPPPMPHPEAVE